jgi:hypothetical protein
MVLRLSRFFFSLILLLLILNPVAALAQDGVPIDSLKVALWPEYDRPQMLVIYTVQWSSNLPLPAEVTLRIPAAAGEPNAVAAREVDGALYNVAYQREVRGEWAEITFIAPSREAQLEYYDPGLVKDGSQRNFTYTWPADYAVSALSVQVQQPAGAQDMTITPGLGESAQGGDGLFYYTADAGSFASGQTYAVDLAYQKDTDALSVELVEQIQVQPIEPISNDTPGRITMMDVLPWMVAIVAVLLIVGGALWMWRKPAPAAASLRSRGRRRQARPAEPEQDDGGDIYCHQCGKRAAPGDHFCRVCGTKLRGA